MKSTLLDAPAQWSPFVIVGSVCVIAGGLVAAVTATSPSEHGAWVAAYLVLVGGVAQIGLGLGQAVLTTAGLSRQRLVTELVALHLGNVAVLAGELLAMGSRGGGWLVLAYRLLVAIVLVSIPVGLMFARIGE